VDGAHAGDDTPLAGVEVPAAVAHALTEELAMLDPQTRCGGQQPRLFGAGRQAPAQAAELQRERDEPLLGAVVKVTLEASPLAVPGLDDPRAAAGATPRVDPDVLDRVGGLEQHATSLPSRAAPYIRAPPSLAP
jgi:hypothetical protein